MNVWGKVAARSIGSSWISKGSSECHPLDFLWAESFLFGERKGKSERKRVSANNNNNNINTMNEWMKTKDKGSYHIASRLVMVINMEMECDDTLCHLSENKGHAFLTYLPLLPLLCYAFDSISLALPCSFMCSVLLYHRSSLSNNPFFTNQIKHYLCSWLITSQN